MAMLHSAIQPPAPIANHRPYDTVRSMASIFRDRLLEGKTALVTGGGSGIGQRMAERFAEHGAKVMLVGRKQEKLDAASAGIRSSNGTADTCAVDVRDFPAVQAAMQKTRDQFGEIDILVCGAAGNFPAPVTGMSANAFKSVIDIDLIGTFNTCRAAYEHLRKPGASVISISASHATMPIAYQAHVCAAKAGVDLLTRTLAIEWAHENITVNAISPGLFVTDMTRPLLDDREAYRQFCANIPLGRFAEPQEIMTACLFLASRASSYVTGADIAVDGGWMAT